MKRSSKNGNADREYFDRIVKIAVDVISRHPETNFDELVAHWLSEDIHRKYKVSIKLHMHMASSNRNLSFTWNSSFIFYLSSIVGQYYNVPNRKTVRWSTV